MHISLLYLHERRANDLSLWLRSIAAVESIQVLLLVSNETQHHVHKLTNDCNHHFEIRNIDTPARQELNPQGNKLQSLFREVSYVFGEFKSRNKQSLSLLSQYPNTVLITYDDRMPSLISILKSAHTLKIPVFLPSILTATPDRKTQTSNVLQEKRFVEKVLAIFARGCCRNQLNDEGRLYYSPISFLMLAFQRALPDNPWAKGTSRFVSVVGVEAVYIRDLLLDFGVPIQKMSVTGLPVYDFMDFSTDQRISKKVLLLALPQYAEHGAMGLAEAMSNIREIFQGLSVFEGRIVVSLHPRMKREDYEPEIRKFGYECATENAEHWIKRCSLFVAANSSSTIYWALMLGVRTLLLNHVYPKSDLFRHFESLQYIEDSPSQELPKFVVTSKANWDQLIEDDQKKLSMELVSDGHCGRRNLEIISTLQSRPA